MAVDTSSLSQDELKFALAKAVSARPWPLEGTVVTIANDWDGASLYRSDEYLTLKAGTQVTVQEIGENGLLFGFVKGQGSQKGWFGGMGCQATYPITLSVPLGPADDQEDILPPLDYQDEFDRPQDNVQEEAYDPEMKEHSGAEDPNLLEAVDAYLERNGIDETASEKLRELDPQLQSEVIRSDITNCRNPSAVLLSRIERLKNTGSVDAPGFRSNPTKVTGFLSTPRARSRSPRRPVAYVPAFKANGRSDEVEDFIQRLRLDDKCAAELRSLSYDEQLTIVRKELTNVKNPSAVVLSRIRNVREADAPRNTWKKIDEIEEYLERNSIEGEACQALRDLPRDLQQQIMASDISNSRNPSAVLLSRIKSLEAGSRSFYTPAPQPAPASKWDRPAASTGGSGHAGWRDWKERKSPVEEYIQQHRLDDRVAGLLRELSPADLESIMGNNITNARNPSAIVASRIAALKTPNQHPSHHHSNSKSESNARSDVESYIQRYNFDDGAAQQLRDLPRDLQLRIIEQEMSNVRNPSAVLLSRIRAALQGKQ